MAELSNAQVEAQVSEFQRKLEELRLAFEQYFMGLEKKQPFDKQTEVERLLRAIDQLNIRNTAIRYRFQNAVQKLNTYKTYWNRTLKSIEDGTYHREVSRLKRRLSEEGVDVSEIVSGNITTAKLEAAILHAKAQKASAAQIRGKPAEELSKGQPSPAATAPTSPAPTAAAAPPSVTPPPVGVTPPAASVTAKPPPFKAPPPIPPAPTRTPPPVPPTAPTASRSHEALYQRFVKAKKMCGEDTADMKYESLAKTIDRQLPELKTRYPNKNIEFDVVIRNGRAFLKATPK